MHVAVIGAGITGLAAAVELRGRGATVTVLEAAPRVGGVITTIERDGWLVEAGPTSLTATAQLEGLIDQLGLRSERISTSDAAKRRYIVRDGALVALPDGPGSLAGTRAISARAKFALLREPFVRARRDRDDESLADLVRRRLDAEILDYLVNPLVAGIYAGDPERLSVRYAMPMLYDGERKHGSLMMGAMKEMKAKRGVVRQRGITSFVHGLRTLPEAMAAYLGESVRTSTSVTRVEQHGTGWRLSCEGATPWTLDADAVLCSAPSYRLTALGLPDEVRGALGPIARLHHPPVATLALGFRQEDIEHPLDGFGVLMPAVEKRTVLGVLFSSSVFAGRAPDGHVLLTCFLGGLRSPKLGNAELTEVLPLVLADLRALLGVRGDPVFINHQRWATAIPQYELGHELVVNAAASIESALPGLYLTGQWRGGVALGDCIAQGQATAARLVSER
jgi:protoporphyrinogen/coproporphyrinogen III oxidase